MFWGIPFSEFLSFLFVLRPPEDWLGVRFEPTTPHMNGSITGARTPFYLSCFLFLDAPYDQSFCRRNEFTPLAQQSHPCVFGTIHSPTTTCVQIPILMLVGTSARGLDHIYMPTQLQPCERLIRFVLEAVGTLGKWSWLLMGSLNPSPQWWSNTGLIEALPHKQQRLALPA